MTKLRICQPDLDLFIKLLTFTEKETFSCFFLIKDCLDFLGRKLLNFVYFVYAHYVIKIYKLAVWMKTFVNKEIQFVVWEKLWGARRFLPIKSCVSSS